MWIWALIPEQAESLALILIGCSTESDLGFVVENGGRN